MVSYFVVAVIIVVDLEIVYFNFVINIFVCSQYAINLKIKVFFGNF